MKRIRRINNYLWLPTINSADARQRHLVRIDQSTSIFVPASQLLRIITDDRIRLAEIQAGGASCKEDFLGAGLPGSSRDLPHRSANPNLAEPGELFPAPRNSFIRTFLCPSTTPVKCRERGFQASHREVELFAKKSGSCNITPIHFR